VVKIGPKSRFLGWVAGLCGGLLRPRPVTPRDLDQADYSTSTQRLGLRFTEKVRDVFRFRWIKPRR
jgi:hypothetical protein